jgi:lysophospholipase L1-like esterase
MLSKERGGDCGRTVLAALGDSVTSAHIQNGFGDECAHTLADRRGLPGNHATMSYAGLYAGNNRDLVSYYNVARTGFGSNELVSATPAHADACRSPWQRAFPPVQLAAAVVKEAKRVGDTAYAVGTVGANDTNWAHAIAQALTCRAAQYAVAKTGVGEFRWQEGTDPARLIPDGGGCVVLATVFGDNQRYVFGVEPYNGAQRYGAITANVRAMTGTLLQAGADKVVWMSYYDITPAQIDVTSYLTAVIKAKLPKSLQDKLPDLAPHRIDLIDAAYAPAVRGMIGQVNTAVAAGLPNDGRVVHAPPAVAPTELQNTMIGGAPHPNGDGHARMSRALAAALGD